MSKIIQNAIRVKATGEFLKSSYRHDFRSVGEGEELVAVDGGTEYLRRLGNPDEYDDWSLTSESAEEEIDQKLLWGTYGKNGDKPLKYVPLCECETEHLEAILDSQHLSSVYRSSIHRILAKRYLPE